MLEQRVYDRSKEAEKMTTYSKALIHRPSSKDYGNKEVYGNLEKTVGRERSRNVGMRENSASYDKRKSFKFAKSAKKLMQIFGETDEKVDGGLEDGRLQVQMDKTRSRKFILEEKIREFEAKLQNYDFPL
jgi:hypothetical protein